MKTLIIFLLVYFCSAYEIENFNTIIFLGEKEKKVKNEIRIKIPHKTKELQWSFPIMDTQQIHPLQFSVKKKFYKVYLKNNRVFFSIFDIKKNEILEINIYYKVLNTEKFLQTQMIGIPSLHKKFNAKIQVDFDKKWEVFSYHPNFSRQKDSYIFYGLIDKKDFVDYFWLSLREANWDINVKNYLYTQYAIENLNILLPKYFKNSNLKIKKIALDTNFKNAQVLQNINNTSFLFRGEKSQDFMVELDAKVNNSMESNQYKRLDPKYFLSDEKNINLQKIAQQIIAKNPKIPPHISIGRWVYENIKYDDKFVNKHINSEQILQVKRGVCEHYAQLYNDMMQSIDIPSVFIAGVGFNPIKKDFEYHAWNLVYIDQKWIPIDATWGIFSGKLPVSHIFFYVGYQPLMMYETYEIPIKQTRTEVIQKIKLAP